MNLVEYWEKRCELAEAYIEESPCDHDIYKEQLDAWNNWCEFKKLPIPVVVGQSEQLPTLQKFVFENRSTHPTHILSFNSENFDTALDYIKKVGFKWTFAINKNTGKIYG